MTHPEALEKAREIVHAWRCDLDASLAELIAAALTEARAQGEWQPIETAPSDTELLLGWWESWPTKRWMEEVRVFYNTRSGSLHSWATHWQPLPAPPAGA